MNLHIHCPNEKITCIKYLVSLISFPSRLRALSSGGSVTSPPLSPALPKYKLADYRYGREEMLALFLKDNKVSMGKMVISDYIGICA